MSKHKKYQEFHARKEIVKLFLNYLTFQDFITTTSITKIKLTPPKTNIIKRLFISKIIHRIRNRTKAKKICLRYEEHNERIYKYTD